MDITITAVGTPGQAAEDVAQQIKAMRDTQPGSWPTLAALRDHVKALTRQSGAENVEVVVAIRIEVKPMTAADALRSLVDPSQRPSGYGGTETERKARLGSSGSIAPAADAAAIEAKRRASDLKP